MKGVITIFLLPFEVEDFAVTLTNLKRNSTYLSNDVEIKLDVMLCLSDTMTDWDNSKLSKEYIADRAVEIFETYADWSPNKSLTISYTTEILGCLSWRRKSHMVNPDADFFIWLDTDMVFRDTTLAYMVNAHKQIVDSGRDEFVITPQIVRQWDSTWDVLVNNNFKNIKLNYQKDADIYTDVLKDYGDIDIKTIPTFKFAGGWFTLISKKLMDRIELPISFGHYGPDDTFIMACCIYMQQLGVNVQQYVLNNLLVGEKYRYTSNKSIKKYITSINNKNAFRKLAEDNFGSEVRKFIEKTENKSN